MPARGKGEEKFFKVNQFSGYVNQPDITRIIPGLLIRGSQNVIVKDNERVGSRLGYTVRGGVADASSISPIESSWNFINFKGDERLLRSFDDRLEYFYNDNWFLLKSGLSSADIIYSRNDWWNTGEKFSEQLFVNGDPTIYSWNGALATLASTTSNSITKEGSATWAEEGFIKNNIGVLRILLTSNSLGTQNFSITVGSTVYTYTATTDFSLGTDINDTAKNIAELINEENNGLIAFEELDEIVVSTENSGSSITAFSGDTNIIMPVLPARQVVIGGITYTYTGGDDTTTLTGVTPNPSTASHAVGSPVVQAVVEYDNDDSRAIPEDFSNDLIEIWNNRVVLASKKSQLVFISKINEVMEYRIRNPRRAGDGIRLTLGAPIVGFSVQKNLNIFAGKSDIYEVEYILSSDLTSDTYRITKLKTSPGEGAQSQRLILPIKNGILYVSNEPAINFLGNVKDIENIQLQNISDVIKIDVERLSFEKATMHYDNRDVYFSLPAHGITLIYSLKDNLWQAPQTLPMSSYQTHNKKLFGFSSLQPESYTMFDALRDRFIETNQNSGFAIPCVASFSYMNFGDREQYKHFNEAYFEGYMSENTKLRMTFLYELYGCKGQSFVNIDLDSNENIFCTLPNTASLGKKSLGKSGLGNGLEIIDETDLPKVRAIPTVGNTGFEFRELGTILTSGDLDERWEVLCFGFAESVSQNQSKDIKIS